jgi:hypothetical protein
MQNPVLGFVPYGSMGLPLVTAERIILVCKRPERAENLTVNGVRATKAFLWHLTDVLAFSDAGYAVVLEDEDGLTANVKAVYERVKDFSLSKVCLEQVTIRNTTTQKSTLWWRPFLNPRAKPRPLTFELAGRIAGAAYLYNRLTQTRARKLLEWVAAKLENDLCGSGRLQEFDTGFIASLRVVFGDRPVNKALVEGIRAFAHNALDMLVNGRATPIPELPDSKPSDHGFAEAATQPSGTGIQDHGDGTFSVCS